MSASQLAQFSTCEISDALIKLNVPHGGLIADIYPATPLPGRRICGPAYTVRMVLTTDTAAPKLDKHFVDTAPVGSVVFIDAPSAARNAVWGGLMSAGALARNVVGVVISGRCRDLEEHREQGFAVFARGHSTLGQSSFTRPSEINIPLVITPPDAQHDADRFSVQILPQDWIVADENGVVCVPRALSSEVIKSAAAGRAVDKLCMAAIQAGDSIQEAFRERQEAFQKLQNN